MKILLQSTLQKPQDWDQSDSSDWASLSKKTVPTGGEIIDQTVGWCHGLNVQGRVFQADHYHVAEIVNGVRVTAWNDDPVDYPPGERYARVVDFLSCVADSNLGGAINTRQTQVVFVETIVRARMGDAIGTTFRRWDEFVPPTSDVMHGIKVSNEKHLDHLAAQTEHGWREWTEGLDPSELDENGRIKQQRPQGRFKPASGTRTYYMQNATRGSGLHGATDDLAFELTPDSDSVTESTASDSDEITFLFSSPVDEPDQAIWTTGVFRCSFDAATVGSDMEFGLLTLGGSVGHFGRVSSNLFVETQQKQQTQGAISATGITVVDTGSVTWGGTLQSDRFEATVAQRNTATMGGPQTLTLTCDADAYADGPWPIFGAIPVLVNSYRKRRVP